MTSAIIDEILRYKKILDESPSDHEILEIFGYLEDLGIDRSLLSKTKIGVTVSKHKQNENPIISTKSKKLLEKWRAVVAATKSIKSTTTTIVSENSTTSDVAGHQSIFSEDKFGQDLNEYRGRQCGDMKRDKARELLYKSFIEGLPPEQLARVNAAVAGDLIGSIEDALWAHYIDKKNNNREYQTQLRSIKSNFGDKKNPEFNIRVYLGAIGIDKITTMPSTDMASDAKKMERAKALKDSLEACQSDWDLRNVKRAAGQFPCGKCKSSNTTYFQMQTRSSDEPMTTFVNCLDCGHRWKF